ncbi:hypothetical protein AD428_18435 [Achromobacter sp. DMS1]|nr:hypothetical protein [Achromobacter sp. DMS1]KOF52710.1 hypothetical protein AD428_18435 [Achromobacter sp. DMS1]
MRARLGRQVGRRVVQQRREGGQDTAQAGLGKPGPLVLLPGERGLRLPAQGVQARADVARDRAGDVFLEVVQQHLGRLALPVCQHGLDKGPQRGIERIEAGFGHGGGRLGRGHADRNGNRRFQEPGVGAEFGQLAAGAAFHVGLLQVAVRRRFVAQRFPDFTVDFVFVVAVAARDDGQQGFAAQQFAPEVVQFADLAGRG